MLTTPTNDGDHEPDRLLKLPKVCETLACSMPTVYQLMNSGQLPFVMIGRTRRVALSAIRKFIEASQRTGVVN